MGDKPFSQMTRDEQRISVFGGRGESNQIWLRQIFPELSIEKAFQYLEMVAENDHYFTEEEKAEALKTTALQILIERGGAEEMARYYAHANDGAFRAYQTYMHLHVWETQEGVWTRRFAEVTGLPLLTAFDIGEGYQYDATRLDEAVIVHMGLEPEGQENGGWEGEPNSRNATAGPARVSWQEKEAWIDKFMEKTQAPETEAQHWGSKYNYRLYDMETAVGGYAQLQYGQQFADVEEKEEQVNGTTRNELQDSTPVTAPRVRMPRSQPPAALDNLIITADNSPLPSWRDTPINERLLQLHLAHHLNTLEAFSYIVATPRMPDRAQETIRARWAHFSRRHDTDMAVTLHLREQDHLVYQDVTQATAAQAIEHLRNRRNFREVIELGFNGEMPITPRMEDMITRWEDLRALWEARKARLVRLRELILAYGYTTLKGAIARAKSEQEASSEESEEELRPVTDYDGAGDDDAEALALVEEMCDLNVTSSEAQKEKTKVNGDGTTEGYGKEKD